MAFRRPSWLDARRPSVAQRIALAPLSALAALYGLGALLHRMAYTLGLRRRRRLSCRVVSIGNLVAGGSGKTPTAAWVARQLRARGHKVALASRGYGRRDREPVRIVSDGRYVRSSLEESGDEPLLLAAHAPGVPVLVGRDRAVAGLRAIAAFGADVLVLDDGFQHHRLHRDVDIVTFDGSGLGSGALLPRGPLREPLRALRAAHALVVVDGPLRASDEARIRRHAERALWASARRRPVGLRPLAGGALQDPEELRGSEVGLLSGIAQPASLRRSVEQLGARVIAERSFPDHHRFSASDLRGLAAEAPLWVTTEKDAIKILPDWVAGADVRVLVIELEMDEGEVFLDWLESRLHAAR